MEVALATLIHALGSYLSRIDLSAKRFAYRLRKCLRATTYAGMYFSIGERTRHPDFFVFHPNRGLLVLEVSNHLSYPLANFSRKAGAAFSIPHTKHQLSAVFPLILRLARENLIETMNTASQEHFSEVFC